MNVTTNTAPTLTDLTHSLKTPLAVLQSTLRSLRNEKMSVSKAEPVMLEQISRISQQIDIICIVPVCVAAAYC
ncbi:sensor protein PhoQ, regulator of virulence determinants [Salmonella bongori]|nr:sensor protein PhoQ, regulator of virulence determinants [Salmonella bongori]